MRKKPIMYDEYTEEELLSMSKKQAVGKLTEREQRFCEHYVEGHNRRLALVKAGYAKSTTNAYSYRLLKRDEVKRYIQWIKARALNECLINAVDLIDAWARIAFSDMTDFVEIRPHSISLKPADEVDGQLIKAIKSGRDGISIELHDKLKALDCLSKYVDDMPPDWKQRIEERKVELLEQEFELKKAMAGDAIESKEDDGLIKAIEESTQAIWEN